ncbi:MAG: Gfo/Idh/MocA family oxidoreductase [Bacteroidetes bacterium]|nr:Gfo/Idh/MocA family oxidoreductase [Bacteroidota bacterium]MBU1372973.1 Gfo/Idh/MocA family oxidoreductase [Bacteroidota bacterium]MBU1485416.1 Gfo/Idh/MocA family oxidoreductase [Bacteroidota bacterium]MBU1759989.1 Gfo/Idh/MocA family oxidoreductase [Bacteroidota bacterium]MBU2269144.1 Gfo/Idh/MocA family oxidoreductase [Bacteroidota bacterium]
MKEENKSRRNFIKSAAVATAAFTIVPRFVLGGKGFLAPSDKLYIAGVGAGGKGYSDLQNFYKTGKANIAFLCDVDDRRSAQSRADYPQAKYYKDWRELLDKESKNFDAVSVSTPDHNHAITTLAAMQLGKHVYVQKPLTHDIYESHILGEAAKRYKVVTQMGNQGASNDGVRQMKEWYNAGLLGDVHTIYCWTNRPVWPQGIPWPSPASAIPKELDWNLWLGTAPQKEYVDKLVPFNWRGWWDYGTGALGDMGCHLMEGPFTVLNLKNPETVEASVGSVYVDEFKRGYFPESCPPSSHVILGFPELSANRPKVKLHWMDGGIQPERPEELGAGESFGDGGNGMLFIGTKGKMMADTYNLNARLLPLSKNTEVFVPQTLKRVEGQMDGHYGQWVDACIAGYGKNELSSPFEKAVPLTEALLIANLAIRAHDVGVKTNDKTTYPGRNLKLLWDSKAMKVTNFDEVNQFVKRQYREGWNLTM